MCTQTVASLPQGLHSALLTLYFESTSNCQDSFHHNRVDMLNAQACKSSVFPKHVSPGRKGFPWGQEVGMSYGSWWFSWVPCLTRPQRGRTRDAPYNHLRCSGWLCSLWPQHQYSAPSNGTFLGWHVAIIVLWYLLFCFLKRHLKARSPTEVPSTRHALGSFRQR